MLVDRSVMNLAIAAAPEIYGNQHYGNPTAVTMDTLVVAASTPAVRPVPNKHDPQPLAQSRGDSAYFVVTRRR